MTHLLINYDPGHHKVDKVAVSDYWMNRTPSLAVSVSSETPPIVTIALTIFVSSLVILPLLRVSDILVCIHRHSSCPPQS